MKTLSNASFIVIFILVWSIFLPAPLSAQMNEVSEDELSSISAQAGINANYGNFGVNITTDSIRFSDTDHSPANWMEFNNFSITGPGGPFYLDCPVDYPMTIDVGTITTTDSQTRTLVAYQLSDHTSTRIWNVGNFVFHDGATGVDTDLGSINFDTSTVNPSYFAISSHIGAGTSGLEFEYLTSWLTNDFTYTYNTNGDSLNFHGIHLAETMSGAPEDPSTWGYNGMFRIGDVIGGNIHAEPAPATMDVATDTSATPTTALYINLPMKGSARVEAVTFGGNNFGPVAIDGITVHHLGLKFNPGN